MDCGSGVSNLVIRAKRVISLVRGNDCMAYDTDQILFTLFVFLRLGGAMRGLHVGFEREGVVRWMGDEGLRGLICGEHRWCFGACGEVMVGG